MKWWIIGALVVLVSYQPVIRHLSFGTIYHDHVRSPEIDISTLQIDQFSLKKAYHHAVSSIFGVVYPDDAIVREYSFNETRILYKLPNHWNPKQLSREEVERSIGAIYRSFNRDEKNKNAFWCVRLSKGFAFKNIDGIALVGPNVIWPENLHCTVQDANEGKSFEISGKK